MGRRPSMEDIGAAGIYNHVTAKSELLVAALTRPADALHMDAGRISPPHPPRARHSPDFSGPTST